MTSPEVCTIELEGRAFTAFGHYRNDETGTALVYPTADGTVQTWHGAVLGRYTIGKRIRLTRTSFTHGRYVNAMRVVMTDGSRWYGRGSAGIELRLRRCKA